MNKVWSVAKVTILQSFRRKDPYVVIILVAVLVFGAGLFSTFGTEGLGKFVKDVGFTITNVMAVVLCVITAARQMPTEIENRTLYPLLAKPVSRLQVYLGKYLGVGIMSTAVVLLFFIELYFLFQILGIPVSAVFWQALYLRILSMWIIAGFVLTMSMLLTSGANVTISLLVCLAMQTFANTITTVETDLQGIGQVLLRGFYFILPQLHLFDLSKKEIHGWPPVELWVLAALTIYAAVYSAAFLAIGAYRFHRTAL